MARGKRATWLRTALSSESPPHMASVSPGALESLGGQKLHQKQACPLCLATKEASLKSDCNPRAQNLDCQQPLDPDFRNSSDSGRALGKRLGTLFLMHQGNTKGATFRQQFEHPALLSWILLLPEVRHCSLRCAAFSLREEEKKRPPAFASLRVLQHSPLPA